MCSFTRSTRAKARWRPGSASLSRIIIGTSLSNEWKKRETKGSPAERRAEYKGIEYPPLAVLFMRLPTLWVGEAGDDSDFDQRYLRAYRGMLAVADALIFTLLLFQGSGVRGQGS